MIGGGGGTEVEKLLKTTVFAFLSSEKDAPCLGPNSRARERQRARANQ